MPLEFHWEMLTFSFTYMLFPFQIIYKAHSKVEMSKVTTPANAIDLQRAKWAQQLTNRASLHQSNLSTICFTRTDRIPFNIFFCMRVSQQYIYTDLAAKERAHYTPETDTPNMELARKMKVVYSDVRVLPFVGGILVLFTRLSLYVLYFLYFSLFFRTNTKSSMRRWSTDTLQSLIRHSWPAPRKPISSPVTWVNWLIEQERLEENEIYTLLLLCT